MIRNEKEVFKSVGDAGARKSVRELVGQFVPMPVREERMTTDPAYGEDEYVIETIHQTTYKKEPELDKKWKHYDGVQDWLSAPLLIGLLGATGGLVAYVTGAVGVFVAGPLVTIGFCLIVAASVAKLGYNMVFLPKSYQGAVKNTIFRRRID